MQYFSFWQSIQHPFLASSFTQKSGICEACGKQSNYEYLPVISDELARQWEINKKLQIAFSNRESLRCSECHCSARLRALAKAITQIYAPGADSLAEGIEQNKLEGIRVAEINSCGELHQILSRIPGLAYSEYTPNDKSIRHEDLQQLTYNEGEFDLVLTSDTLEHVPDYQLALTEIHRILKPGGYHIFTVPLIFSRQTRRRVEIADDSVTNIVEPSYHGSGESDNLVVSEFGIDFMNEVQDTGFKVKTYFANPLNLNEVNCVFVAKKVTDG